MAKSFTDVVQDSLRTGLGIPVKTKNPLSRTIAQKRLHQVKADLTVLSIQPGGELRD